MDYHAHYSRLIARAADRELTGYSEKHHIVPRCMGGTDDADNLARLTAREHFVAHQLLCKMYPGVGKLIFAVMVMCQSAWGGRITNRAYGWLRERHSAVCNSPDVVAKRSAAMKARHAAGDPSLKIANSRARTPEATAKRLASHKVTAQTPEFKARATAAALKRWETRDKAAAREVLLRARASIGQTKGSRRCVAEVLPNGFIVNEHLDIKALAKSKGVTYSALWQQLKRGHPTMEIIPR